MLFLQDASMHEVPVVLHNYVQQEESQSVGTSFESVLHSV